MVLPAHVEVVQHSGYVTQVLLRLHSGATPDQRIRNTCLNAYVSHTAGKTGTAAEQASANTAAGRQAGRQAGI